jgi:hypothetical protein
MHFLETIKSNPKGLTTFGPTSNTPAIKAIIYSLSIYLKKYCFSLLFSNCSEVFFDVLATHFTINSLSKYDHKYIFPKEPDVNGLIE